MNKEKADQAVSFALTKTEKRELVNVCEKLNIRMSDYIRTMVMKQVKKNSKEY